MTRVKDVITEKNKQLMATIPLIMGVSPICWQHALNIMLENVCWELLSEETTNNHAF